MITALPALGNSCIEYQQVNTVVLASNEYVTAGMTRNHHSPEIQYMGV